MTDSFPTSSQSDKDTTILLVDDDPKLLKGLCRHLEDEHYKVITAVCPAEAKVFLSRHKVDLIVSDNLMPGNLGTNFLSEVRAEYPDVKMIMLSGYLPHAAAVRVVDQVGVQCVLIKPCPARIVANAIREAIS